MKLTLERPLAFFDIESTGVTVGQYRIVEIGILKALPNGKTEFKEFRVNPQMPIPPHVSAIHGITDDMVKDKPSFADIAPNLYIYLNDCDLGGYNSNKFDVPMLVDEFQRAGYEFDVTERSLIDVQNIFHKKEPRTLVAAYKFYCGKDLENAHSAEADIRATYEVLLAQLEKYADLKGDVHFLNDYTRRHGHIDLGGRFAKNEAGVAVFNFGKHKGKPITEVLAAEPSYYGWMMNGNFAPDTKTVLT
jgi:DNA polymerase-3 subunit epsilon